MNNFYLSDWIKALFKRFVQFISEFKTSMINLTYMPKLSGTNQSIPYVISPRNAFVDTRRPKLRWNNVQGATSYTVKIVTDSKIIWEKTVKEPEFNSSEDLPLEVGVDYSLIVESDTGRSSQMDSAQSLLVFGLLDEAKNTAMAKELSQAEKLELPEDRKIRSVIDVYTTYGLNAKAIELLEQKVINESLESLLLHQELGNLYQCVGFYHLAEEQYRKALTLITDEQVQEKISSQIELQKVLSLMGREDEAEKVKAELEAFKSKNLAQSICASTCSGKCGECNVQGDPGKWFHIDRENRICLTAGC